MNLFEQIISETEKRYHQQEKIRASRLENLGKGNWMKADDPGRILFRMKLLGMDEVIKEAMIDMGTETGAPKLNVLERILDENELTNVYFLLRGAFVSHSVGRVVIRSYGGRIAGYGTGFMVSPTLMMTNNHVLKDRAVAERSTIQFNYQRNYAGIPQTVEEFALDPNMFFRTHEYLDFTLVAVSSVNASKKKVREFGWNPLIGQSGKALLKERVNIIQHPGGEHKQVALRENQVIDMPDDFLHYKTDTMPGSSGSPVFNCQWIVAALHHSGVPARKNNRIILNDGSYWDGSPGTRHRIKWIANEGIRISAIVKHIKSLNLSFSEEKLFAETQDLFPEMPEKQSMIPNSGQPGGICGAGQYGGYSPLQELNGTSSWYFKLNFGPVNTVMPSPVDQLPQVLPQLTVPVGADYPPVPQDDDESDFDDEAVAIDTDYSNRKGYDPGFLGSGDECVVPLPDMNESMLKDAAVNSKASGNDRYTLPYHHYSVVMNGKRRLAYFVAVNIDGKQFRHIRRERDKWYFDPRIKRSQQVGNRLYKRNPLDRGHLVRRQDPCWGKTYSVAKVANDDTFHYTNCAPQHEDLNQSNSMWLGLEDYILDNARRKDIRVSVFSGPVFRDDDRFYRGIQLPEEFWKVVVMIKEDDTVSATAYLLSQEKFFRNLEEDFAFGAYRNFQVKISKIESLTDLDFGHLKKHDPLEKENSDDEKELSTLEDIRL